MKKQGTKTKAVQSNCNGLNLKGLTRKKGNSERKEAIEVNLGMDMDSILWAKLLIEFKGMIDENDKNYWWRLCGNSAKCNELPLLECARSGEA